MAPYSRTNLKEVEDMAPKFGFPPEMQSRFARTPLELERTGVTHFTLAPNFRVPFAHRHENQEEVYVVVSGSARVKIGDEVLDLEQWDAVRVAGDELRNLEAGPDGAEVIAFGESATPDETEFVQGWWGN
jgi:quercetin dioxygenase-like cupin family protein